MEYHIIPLSSAGEEFDLTRNNRKGPNSKGQTIGWERPAGGGGIISWFDDPVVGKIILPKLRTATPCILTDSGYVVGVEGGFGGSWYVWSLESGLYRIDPNRAYPRPKAANNYGEVVFDGYDDKQYPLAYMLTKDKNIICLEPIGIYTASGRSINDSCQIVGISKYSGWKSFAFIWDKINGMRDLNHLIPSDSRWSDLIEATHISNKGLIVGHGTYQGKPCEFLLIPVGI